VGGFVADCSSMWYEFVWLERAVTLAVMLYRGLLVREFDRVAGHIIRLFQKMGLIIFRLLSGSLWLRLLCSWCSASLISHPTIWLSMVLGCFVLIWLERALVPSVINRGLLEREFDRVGGRFIRRIDWRLTQIRFDPLHSFCLMNCWGTNCLRLERVVNACC